MELWSYKQCPQGTLLSPLCPFGIATRKRDML